MLLNSHIYSSQLASSSLSYSTTYPTYQPQAYASQHASSNLSFSTTSPNAVDPPTNTPDITYASLTPVSLADCSLMTSTTILNSAGHSVSDGFNGSHNLAVVQADSTLNEEAISGVTSPEKRQVGRNITNNLKKKQMAKKFYIRLLQT